MQVEMLGREVEESLENNLPGFHTSTIIFDPLGMLSYKTVCCAALGEE
jgi:hypothetical protein